MPANTPLGFSWNTRYFQHPYQPFENVDRQIERACFRAKKILSELVYDTTVLEGNPFTFPEVQTLLNGITVGGHKLQDEQQVLNQAKSWKALLDKIAKKEFIANKETFCELHSLVAEEDVLTRGAFRDGRVNIAGTSYRPPPADKLDEIFTNGLTFLEQIANPLELGMAFFLFGSLNQFFWDGNKRTSRLFMNGIAMSSGHEALTIPARLKNDFNAKMVRFYDSKNGDEMMAFLISLSDRAPTSQTEKRLNRGTMGPGD